MSEVEIDLLTDRGTLSIKDIRARRIYNEEPDHNGLSIESILSTLDITADDTFTTSVSGNIIVGATGYYDMNLEQYWDINMSTSGCIHTGTDFCLEIGGLYDIIANSIDTQITGSYDLTAGGLSLHSTGELWLDASTTLNVDATLLDADFTRAEINTGTSFAITTNTNFTLTTVGSFIANTDNTYLNATQNIELGATQIEIVGDGLVNIFSDRSVGITAGDHLLLTADNQYTLNVGNDLVTNVVGDYLIDVTGVFSVATDHHLSIDSGATMTLEAENKMYINSVTDGICLTANGGDLDMIVTGANIVQTTDSAVDINSGTTTTIDANDVTIVATNCISAEADCIELTSTDHLDLTATNDMNLTSSTVDINAGTSMSITAGNLEINATTFQLGVTQLELCDGVILGSTGLVTKPTFSFCEDQDTGIYSPDANNLAFSTGGVQAIVIDENQRLGIGTNNPQQEFHVYGPDSSTSGPHIRLQTASDAYPQMQILAWQHDAVSVNFDSYWDGVGWKSSDVGSNFNIQKISDQLRFQYDSGIAAGSALTWEQGIVLTSTGNVGIGTTNPINPLHVHRNNATTFLANTDQTDAGRTISIFNTNTTTNAFATMSLRTSGALCDMKLVHTGSNISKLVHTLRNNTTWHDVMTLDAANSGRVGIGTTSPGVLLSLGSTLNNTKLGLWENGIVSYGFGIQAFQFRLHLSESAARFSFLDAPAGNELMTIKGTGNVGIGVTNPTQTLDINGDALIQGGNLFLVDTNEKIASDGTDMFFHVNGVEVVRFESGGNVGIGTNNPDSMLHVYGGDSKIQVDSINAFVVEKADGTDCFRIDTTICEITTDSNIGISGTLDVNYGDVTIRNDSDTAFIVTGTTDSCLIVDTITCEITVAGTMTTNNFVAAGPARIQVDNANAFVVENNLGEDCFRIDTTNCSTNLSGDMTISSFSSTALVIQGTSGPSILEVDTNNSLVTINGNLALDNISGDLGISGNLSVTGNVSICNSILELDQGTASAPSLAFCDDLNTGLFSPAADNVALTTSGTERFRVFSTGNIGIGTSTDPLQKLFVELTTGAGVNQNRMFLHHSTLDGAPGFMIGDTFNSATIPMVYFLNESGQTNFGTRNNFPMDIRTNWTSRIFVAAAGNVGIGTTNPSQLLDVNGDALVRGGDLFLVDTNEKIASNGTDMFFHVNGAEVVRFEAGGFVGIGTNNPGFLLDLLAPSTQHAYININRLTTANDSGIRFRDNGTDEWVMYSRGTDNAFLINEGTSNTRIFFQPGGNVGIGTNNPSQQLHVQNDALIAGGDLYLVDTNEKIASNGTDMFFHVGGSETVRFQAGGNVGIGTNLPESKLHVYGGDSRIQNTSTTAFVVEKTDGTDCFVIDTTTCTTTIENLAITDNISIVTYSASALSIEGITGEVCMVVDTIDCGVTIHGDLYVENLQSQSLTISGDLGITGNLSVTGVLSVCNNWIEIDQASAAAPAIRFCGESDTGIFQASAKYFNISTNGSNRFQIDNNGDVAIDTNTLYVDAVNGRIGIATSSPSQILDVNGDAVIQGGDLFLVDTNEKIASDGTDMFFHVGGSEVVRFEAGGNVGIGTNNPDVGLTVNKTVSKFGTNTSGQLTISDQTTFARLASDKLHLWDNNTSIDYAVFDSANSYLLSNLSIGTTVAGDKLWIYAGDSRITQTSQEAFVVENLNSHDCFVVNTTDCIVGVSGQLVVTTNHDDAFVVQGSDKVVLFDFNTNADRVGITANTIISKNSTTAFVVQDVLEDECFVVDTISCGVTIAGSLSTQTLQVPLIVGDVAIDGNFSVTGIVDFCTAQVKFSDGSQTAPSLAFCDDLNTGLYSPADNTLAFTTNGVEKVRIDTNGNVGIGSNAPTQKLDVNGDALIQGGDLFLVDTNEKIASDGTDMFFHVNGAETVRFKSGGSVGIGTNAPASKLHVTGTSRVQVTDANAFVVEKATGEDCFKIDTTTCEAHFDGPVHITSDSVTALHVHNTDGTELFAVDGLNDQVGISGNLEVYAHSSGAFVVQGVTGEDCFVVDTINCTATVHGSLVASTIGISGNLTVNGNLTVHGSETILNTETLTIDDNYITLNGITSPTDTNADGGGIELIGDNTYSMHWHKDCVQTGYGVTAAWEFNQNVNVQNTLGYYIDCKIHHDQQNLLVNTRSNNHAGAFYLSTNDILNPLNGDWRIITETAPGGAERMVFQRFDGSVWVDRLKIN